MSGNLMDSAASLEMHARRRTARQFRNFNDPLRGQPVPPERSLRRRLRSASPANSARLPRRIFEVTPGVPESFSLDQIVDHENLALVWQAMKGHSGWAPGSDRMTFDVSPSQYMGVLRNLSRAIRCREYLPAETRTVRIPKISGGWRTLEIPTLLDRVTGLALVMALRPVLRNRFPRHYGSSSSCHAILARMTVLAETLNWHYLAVDDIRDFYPSIPRALAMDSFMRIADQWGIPGLTLRQQGIPWLIRQLIYGHEGESQEVGLSQGSTFSPLAAAITLSEVLDVVIDNQIENRAVLHRYVDNIHIQGPDDSEVRDAMNATMTILNENSMSLKGNGRTIIDLHNPDGQCILGVIPRWRENRILFDIPETAWDRMRAKLTMGTSGTNPQWNGYILSAFVSAFRPALREEAGSSVDRIMELMEQTAIYSISRETIESWVRTGRNQWNSELNRNRETMATPVSEAENGDEDDQRVWRINTELQPGPETEYPI